MPADNIKRAIMKGTGELPGVTYEEVVYEGYGPGGVAIYLEVLTDNKMRTTPEIRHLFTKHGGNLGGAGSVAYMFKPKGVIAIGQFALGLVTVAQFGVGLVFGFGQFLIGSVVLAQLAGGLVLGVGQVATGYVAIGQVVLAYYGLGQIGLGKFLWTMLRRDAEAVQFFLSWWGYLKQLIH